MQQIEKIVLPLLTRLNEGFGRLRSGYGQLEVRPLIRISEPPSGYIELKIYIHGLKDQSQWDAIKRFYQKFKEYSDPNAQYISQLLKARQHNIEYSELSLARNEVSYMGDGVDPIERIQTRDGAKWMLLVDFDFSRANGNLRRIPQYIPLNPERYFDDYPFKSWQWPQWLIDIVGKSKYGEIPGWVKIEDKKTEAMLEGKEAEEFEKKRAAIKERLPYKDDL